MTSPSKSRDMILDISKFIEQLDESVRLEAFKFLLAEELETSSNPVSRKEPAPAAHRLPDRDVGPRKVAPQELIRQSGASSFTEKAIVLAYWLEEFQQRPTFSTADIKSAFEQAREHSPKNPSDLVAKLETSARIMRAEKSTGIQHYRLTSTAILEVQRWLNSRSEK
jgi:hypothetical protein